MSGRVLALAAAAGVALVAAYVALGGTSYRPTPVADPCASRAVPATGTGTGEAVQRVVLVAVDAAACELGVSREELVLALRSVEELDALARREGIDARELEESVRAGLVRAVGEAEAKDLLGERAAGIVRAAAERLPLRFLLTLLRSVSDLVGD